MLLKSQFTTTLHDYAVCSSLYVILYHQEEDLDYEEEAEPQMKIGVLVSKKQLPVETTTPDHGHILPSLWV